MKPAIRKIGITILAMLAAIFVMLNWTMVVNASHFNDRPDNLRTLLEAFGKDRGDLLVGDKAFAYSEEVGGTYEYQRRYTDVAEYGHMAGYFSLTYGRAMLELTENDFLSGDDARIGLSSLGATLSGQKPAGGNVRTTINDAAQKAAVAGLGSRDGAVAAIDPKTGAILALASTPGYDPNPISSFDSAEASAAWNAYQEDPDKPMLYRTIRETYTPGSTFKVVTMASALQNGYNLDTLIPAPSEYQLPGSTFKIGETDGDCRGTVNGKITLEQALIVSCNTAFAGLAVELGESKLRATAEGFGINDEGFKIPLDVVGSSLGDIPGDAELAQSGIGLRDVRLTALQNAMIAAAIANGGAQMHPYLVDEYLDSEGTLVDQTAPLTWRRSVSESEAADLTQAMIGVVRSGTGGSGAVSGVTVAGKTGTATKENGPSDGWFISFAPANDPQIAVAVIVQASGSGGKTAAPISSKVMQAYFNSEKG